MALIIAETNRMNRGRLIELFEMITDNWRADAYEKLDYIHENPVNAGIVWEAEQCVYSSAIGYADGTGLLDAELLL